MRIEKKINYYFTQEEIEKIKDFKNLMEELSDRLEDEGICDDNTDIVEVILDNLEEICKIIKEETERKIVYIN